MNTTDHLKINDSYRDACKTFAGNVEVCDRAIVVSEENLVDFIGL